MVNGVSSHGKGFDEYMNLILDDAEEVNLKTSTREKIGSLLSFASHLCRSHFVEG